MTRDMTKRMAAKNKKGMSLHKYIATGGKPSDYNKTNPVKK